ncbi:MFS transporter [Catellatospora sp. TT07R-123]|uniref:MFS transporter n=1 Tax=Catellatospora sp. TT07R-123 TaxID=2733863 RepID=UPI001B02AB1F|nr:MFS transporter [Catellatospora sp. TT07R-123]GHJ48815.1 MFS transporter [Catellatospora sp. TT07R-123]
MSDVTASDHEQGRWAGRGLLPPAGPQRTLAVATFVTMLGSGVYMVAAALYFTRSVGLSVAQVGLGMGVAGLAGLLAGVPVGHLADRRGPREVYLATQLVQAAAMAALVLVHTFWQFTAVLCAVELSRAAGAAARGPLVRGFGGEELPRFRAYLRSVANLAISLGAVGAGVAVQLDSRAAYLALVLGNAVSFVACAAITRTLPPLAPVPVPAAAGRWLALRDPAFIAVTALDSLLGVQGAVLMYALPLWIVGHTDAPRGLVGVTALLNTAMVVVLQVRVGRRVDSGAAAARAMRRCGWAFLAGMAVIALAAGLPGWAATALVLVGVAGHTVGELWHAAGSLELRFRLAPRHAQGQYTGVSGLGTGLAGAAAPTVLGLLCVSWGAPGWLLMGAVFVLAGLAVPAAVRWAERTRPIGTRPA